MKMECNNSVRWNNATETKQLETKHPGIDFLVDGSWYSSQIYTIRIRLEIFVRQRFLNPKFKNTLQYEN